MNITPDQLLLLLGSKEAELFLLRAQIVSLTAERDTALVTAKAADAEVSRLKDERDAEKASPCCVDEKVVLPDPYFHIISNGVLRNGVEPVTLTG